MGMTNHWLYANWCGTKIMKTKPKRYIVGMHVLVLKAYLWLKVCFLTPQIPTPLRLQVARGLWKMWFTSMYIFFKGRRKEDLNLPLDGTHSVRIACGQRVQGPDKSWTCNYSPSLRWTTSSCPKSTHRPCYSQVVGSVPYPACNVQRILRDVPSLGLVRTP